VYLLTKNPNFTMAFFNFKMYYSFIVHIHIIEFILHKNYGFFLCCFSQNSQMFYSILCWIYTKFHLNLKINM